MKTEKTFLYGVTALVALCLFGAPMVHAQLLDGTVHEAKIGSSAIAYVPMVGLVKEGGKATLPVVLRSTGANAATGGFDYDINVLIDMGPGVCGEATFGELSTYTGEDAALVEIDASEFPEPGLSMIGRLFAKVQTKTGKSSVKSVAGWMEVFDGADPEPEGISKSIKFQAKEKEPAKLVDCTVP